MSAVTLTELSRCRAAHDALVTTLCCDPETSSWVHEHIVQLERYTRTLLAHRIEETLFRAGLASGKTLTHSMITAAKIELLRDLAEMARVLGEPQSALVAYRPPRRPFWRWKPFWRRWLGL